MTEFYVQLQDADGTGYVATGIADEVVYFDDLDEARLFAKDQLDDEFILASVITDKGRVVDFFRR